MLNVEIDYRNVETRVDNIREYIEQNIIEKIEENYDILLECLSEEKGLFKSELICAIEKEKISVLEFANGMKELCESIQHMSVGFEEIDRKTAEFFEYGAN